MTPGWSQDFTVVDAEMPADDALARVLEARAPWVLVERAGGQLRYVFSRGELLARPHLHALMARHVDLHAMPLAQALDLHEGQASLQMAPGDAPSALPIDPAIPSQARCVAVADGRVVAVGGADVVDAPTAATAPPRQWQGAEPPATAESPADAGPPIDVTTSQPIPVRPPIRFRDRPTSGASPAPPSPAPPFSVDIGLAGPVPAPPRASFRGRPTRSKPPAPDAPDAPDPAGAEPPDAAAAPTPSATSATNDEGVAPIRFPSIDASGALAPGTPVAFIVDLQREEAPETFGGVALPAQPVDWTTLDVDVLLASPQVEFDPPAGTGGVGRITVRRNADSMPARVTGRLRADLPRGAEIEVKARFLLGTRFCGSAARRFVAGAGGAPAEAAGAAAAAVQLDADATAPDLTVFITLFDRSAPGRLHWRLVTPPFPGLPPRLDGPIDLGRDPAAEASALFSKFAKLERGQHREAIEGFGEQLWQRAPQAFRDAYWALHDHYRRPLTIQFVSDDPHLPWELMAPFRDGESHGPLALRHAVARWIGQWQGYMRNRLPAGRLVAVAPHYRSASTQLSLAEAAAQALVDKLGAQRCQGTREQLLALLEQPPADTTVALLYFTGHGAFAADTADASLIKLEGGGQLSSLEVARQKVRLGERDGTVVFLNACEVGATGSVLGNVGGWADAFLSRRFGAFIAPLWAIDEEDAAQVTEDLMAHIVTQREPLGGALRDLRVRYGDVSPTFYSYLLYGDVTARLGRA